jgi:phage terminase small subunit
MTPETNEDLAVPPAPPHLSERSAALWRAVVPSRAKSAERQALVITALDALDLADECRARVRAEGLTATTKTTGAVHIHPLMKVEKEQRSLFAKIWGQLNFQWNQTIDGRS